MRTSPWTGSLAALALACAGPALGDDIADLLDEITIDALQAPLRVLTGVDPVPGVTPTRYLENRYSYGEDIHVAAAYIQAEFQALGLAASLHEFDAAFGPNVIGELPGTVYPEDIYVICGHYDTYHSGDQLHAPGCDDNGSGTAAVILAARVLASQQFAGTVRFVAFAGEEQWMVGSSAYAERCLALGENVVAAINLDMFLQPSFDNMDPDPDHDLDIGANPESFWLAQHLGGLFAEYTTIDVQLHESDDFVSNQWGFWQSGYDAVGLIENTPQEIWGGSNDAYHQLTDTMDNPDYEWDFAREVVRGAVAGLVDLAGLIACPADLDPNGEVDAGDLLFLLAAWGTDAADLDGDGTTSVADLLLLLEAWGPCDD